MNKLLLIITLSIFRSRDGPHAKIERAGRAPRGGVVAINGNYTSNSAAPEVASDVAEERIRQFIERQAARGAAPRGVARLEGPDDDEVAARTR